MKRLIILLLIVLSPLFVVAQNYTVSGTVSDSKTGETIIGATVVDMRSGKGAVTNAYGRYSLTLKKDSVEVRVQYVGYEPQYFRFALAANREMNVKLKPSVQLDEVTGGEDQVGAGDVR